MISGEDLKDYHILAKFVQILSHAFGIPLSKEELSKENIKKICKDIKVPEFKKKENLKIDIDDGTEDKKEKEKKKEEEKKEEEDKCLYMETPEMKKEREAAEKMLRKEWLK